MSDRLSLADLNARYAPPLGPPRRESDASEFGALVLWCERNEAESDAETAAFERRAQARARRRRRARACRDAAAVGASALVSAYGLLGPSLLPLEWYCGGLLALFVAAVWWVRRTGGRHGSR